MGVNGAARPTRESGISRSEWRVLVLASLGGALEFYDFVIYSVFAPYIGQAFFPSSDPLVSLSVTYAVLAFGYLARPVGGAVLSHFGDRYGRRRVLITTILTMSGATFCMGFLPTYAQWGLGACFAMLGLRLLQGLCVGGELPGAITYAAETAPRQAGFAAGVIFFCVNTGVVLATLLNLGLQETLAPADVARWGWRIAYFAGGGLGLISFWLRLSLEESAEFSRMRGVAEKRPFREVMRAYPVQVVVGIGACAASAGFNGLLFAYIPAHLTKVLHYSPIVASQAQNLCLGVLSFGLVTAAWIGDRIPRRWILGLGAVLGLVFAYPFFRAAETHSVNLMVLAVAAGVIASLFNGACVGVIGDLFPTRVRYSGVALGFNIAFSLGSALAPLVATRLVAMTHSAASPAWYMGVCAILTLAASLVLRRYEGRIVGDLETIEAASPAAVAAQ